LELLKQMTFYATSGDCLRRRLLAYFGESSPTYCGHCSNCLVEYEESDVTLEARKIISCVYRLRQRGRAFGKTMIADILRGSKNEKIRRSELDTLSTWGIMADTSAHRIRTIIDFLIDEGCLQLYEESEYPVVVMGEAEDVLKEERRLIIKLPRERKKSPIETPLAEMAEIAMTQTPSAAMDTVLFGKLKGLRKEIAARESVPAYIVFSDASLRDMCRKKPVTLPQFSDVTGVGEVKREKYGAMFTILIRDYLTS